VSAVSPVVASCLVAVLVVTAVGILAVFVLAP
jgi:hypothetical protein